jgi:membrane associated rhomboid family serine protease
MNNIPTITKNLLIINVAVFVATYIFRGIGVDLNNVLGLHFFLAPDFHIYQLFTYMFAHGGFSHIFFNMFALWMFGCIVERTWGPKKFLFYYIVCAPDRNIPPVRPALSAPHACRTPARTRGTPY